MWSKLKRVLILNILLSCAVLANTYPRLEDRYDEYTLDEIVPRERNLERHERSPGDGAFNLKLRKTDQGREGKLKFNRKNNNGSYGFKAHAQTKRSNSTNELNMSAGIKGHWHFK
ncbi:unnamed protein product [Ceratitis capitata]|uniref:(Mediterranean fruit fly) hypothetical protein n=1 Tax=Ceratitis capitata TaxID=7213 RepID=A0A811UVX7_CERCA|nr:unnamed protein product [Ceratitis capitata]